jgi:hypothetical protein
MGGLGEGIFVEMKELLASENSSDLFMELEENFEAMGYS